MVVSNNKLLRSMQGSFGRRLQSIADTVHRQGKGGKDKRANRGGKQLQQQQSGVEAIGVMPQAPMAARRWQRQKAQGHWR